MDMKDAAKLAKEYVADLFDEEGISNVGLEEIVFRDDGGDEYWDVTVGFSRPWDHRGLATRHPRTNRSEALLQSPSHRQR